jgi:hypothetical protein
MKKIDFLANQRKQIQLYLFSLAVCNKYRYRWFGGRTQTSDTIFECQRF